MRRFLESKPIFAMFSARVVKFAAGTSELEMPWRRDLTYDGTAIPATINGDLIDFAGGSAAATLLLQGWGIMTTGFEVHNIAPATGQRMDALGEALHMCKRTGPARADVFSERDGKRTLCASSLVTVQAVAVRSRVRERFKSPRPSAWRVGH